MSLNEWMCAIHDAYNDGNIDAEHDFAGEVAVLARNGFLEDAESELAHMAQEACA
jgi:hypothetical protein